MVEGRHLGRKGFHRADVALGVLRRCRRSGSLGIAELSHRPIFPPLPALKS